MKENCCQDQVIADINSSGRIRNNVLYLTINNKTIPIDLSGIVGDGGEGIPEEIRLDILSDGYALFTNAIPEDRKLTGVYVEGNRQTIDVDYVVIGRNITWISPDFTLIPSLRLIITVE